MCAASWLTLGEEDAVDCATTLPERAPLYRALLAAVHVICRCVTLLQRTEDMDYN